jgi:tetratricopeptide (TPR) repeat protein
VGDVEQNLASLLTYSARLDEAESLYQDLTASYRASGDRRSLEHVLSAEGTVFLERLELEKAQTAFAESLRIAREVGDKRGEGYSLGGLGAVFEYRDDLGGARTRYEEWMAVAMRADLGTKPGTTVRTALAVVAMEESRHADAESLASEVASQTEGTARGYAESIRAWALFELKKRADATEAIERARTLLVHNEMAPLNWHLATISAVIDGSSGDADHEREAFRRLDEVDAETTRARSPRAGFWSRYARGRLQMELGQAVGRTTLATLERDARARGLVVVARLARATARR